MKKCLIFGIILFLIPVIAHPVTPPKGIKPETALQAYLKQPDKSFKWQVVDRHQTEGVSFFRIIFTSQTWRNIPWTHEMIVMVPDQPASDHALLFINGGSVKEGKPNTHGWDDELLKAVGNLSKTHRFIAALLWQVPNQPLYDGLKEDALISYTLHQFLGDRDYSWPLLFPMTKSAVSAMDVIGKFTRKETGKKIRHFVVTGASKRGWTTWLTGASDRRVKAIVPMVIDVLNMPVNIDYQRKVWGDYSVEIEDYVKLGITQQLGTTDGDDLVKMIDPFSYRKSLTMPKMVVMGTNDPYWPVDAVKNYIDQIPGENHFCYVPNAGHGLGDKKQALAALGAFTAFTAAGEVFPRFEYQIRENKESASLKVEPTPGYLTGAVLWSSTSSDRDFRDEKWTSRDLDAAGNSPVEIEVAYPESGFKAFYVDLIYKAPAGYAFTQSTRMFVAGEEGLFLEPGK